MEIVHLSAVKTYELRSRVVEIDDTRPSEPELSLEFGERHDETSIENRFRLVLAEPDAEYLVDVASQFSIDEPVSVSPALMAEFGERVGFMVAFPYMREAVSMNAARMGRAVPLIGLMRPGDFHIEVTEDPIVKSPGEWSAGTS